MGDRQPLAADVLAAGARNRNEILSPPPAIEGGPANRERPGTRPASVLSG